MNDKPIKTFRDADDRAVAASIWQRAGAKGTYYDVTFSRAWKDRESGEAGYSHAFRGRNLDAVMRVAKDAQAWVENAMRNNESASMDDSPVN